MTAHKRRHTTQPFALCKLSYRYLEKKNMYLLRQDHNHPSFVVYVEAVNEVYSRYFNRGGGYSVQSIF